MSAPAPDNNSRPQQSARPSQWASTRKQQAQVGSPPAAAAAAAAARALRRDILERAQRGQRVQDEAQAELARQGQLLGASLKEARQVAGGASEARQQVGRLVEEANEGKFKRLLRSCCPCCCCCCFDLDREKRWANGITQVEESRNQTASPSEEQQELEEEAQVLRSLVEERKKRSDGSKLDDLSWKRSLVPLKVARGASKNNNDIQNSQIWHRQVEASLVQLQQVAEEMGQALEEQIKLAQLLDAYLSYGLEQAIGASEQLAGAEAEGQF